ncbi:MAG: potassium-transporting ATPase subunit KdpA [Bacteroidaceae bacterium]
MDKEIMGIVVQVLLMIGLSYPLGRYIAKVYKGEKTFLDFMTPVENKLYKVCSIQPLEQMNWKRFLKVLLTLNLFWFVWGMVLLMTQEMLPLNPDHNVGQSVTQAFNTSISFMVNCNLQHYSGETGVTYFTQLFVVMLFQFTTAATGMAAFAAMLKGLSEKTTQTLGNFWLYLVKSITRILLPLAMVVGLLLMIGGTPMTLEGKQHLTTLEGQEQVISQGPVAAIVAIKQLGTNGGGFFGANASHPLENPSYFTNMIECISILLLPMALIWTFGFYLKKRKFAFTIFGVMLFATLFSVGTSVCLEMTGNPEIAKMGIAQPNGSMEGKETRLGSGATALWAMATTVTSNGSVNGMHDSLTPLTGMLALLNMQINCWFGGVGVGFMNYFIFLVLTVFISGLMVGRTPEFLGKKIEAKEMKIAIFIALLHPFLILTGTALAAYLATQSSTLASEWLHNPSFHGLSEMLYEFTSSAANNGSGFEGLGDNTPFWNIGTGVVLALSRYVPLIGQLAIVGLLAQKKFIPESGGTLKTDTFTFSVITFTVIFIIAALAFFPVLALSPIAEFLTM